MKPFTSSEILNIRRQKANGWSLDRVADYWTRTPAEIDLVLWWTLGWCRRVNITQTRDLINRRLGRAERLAA